MAGGRPRSVGALGRIAVRLRAVHDGAQLPHGPSKVHLLRTDGGTWNFGVRSTLSAVPFVQLQTTTSTSTIVAAGA